MIEAWRWFGPNDPVTLTDARQAGATSIVTALHEIYDGRAWTVEEVQARKAAVEAAGLSWSVCESIPVHDSIKLRSGPWRRYLDNWKTSLASLGRAGVPVVCYNFMPVVDWTRTDLRYRMASGGLALRFDMATFAAYDLHVLGRAGARACYSDDVAARARAVFDAASPDDLDSLERTIIAGLPGGEDGHTRDSFTTRLHEFAGMGADDLRANLLAFLEEVVPVAEAEGVRLAIHPDDPPFSLFGLPRVVSTADDLRAILTAVDSPANGLTLCVGSLSSRPDNDAQAIAAEFADRVHFAHLRNVACDDDGSFTETDHLAGDADMARIVRTLLKEEDRRGAAGGRIPFRPDHGHLLLEDQHRTVNPGYSCIGRLKGLAEIRGVIAGLGAAAA